MFLYGFPNGVRLFPAQTDVDIRLNTRYWIAEDSIQKAEELKYGGECHSVNDISNLGFCFLIQSGIPMMQTYVSLRWIRYARPIVKQLGHPPNCRIVCP